MKNFLLVLCMAFLPMHIMANTQDTIIGRPLKSFDLSAFCSYNSFHPSEYLTDNNWDILCAFVQSGSAAKLDSLGIPYNRSQLRLLEVGDLLMCNNEHYTTKIHIFGKSETQQIRRQSKDFADSIFPKIEPKIRRLVVLLMRPDIPNRPIVLYFRICWIITFGRTSSCHRHVAAKIMAHGRKPIGLCLKAATMIKSGLMATVR